MTSPGLVGMAFSKPQASSLWSWPGSIYYVNADDAVDDGSGKCSSCPDRVAAIAFAQATSGGRFGISTSDLTGHKVLTDAVDGKLLQVTSSPVAGALNGNVALTFMVYFKPIASNHEAAMQTHTDGGSNLVRFDWKTGLSGGTALVRQDITSQLQGVQTFTKTLAWHSWGVTYTPSSATFYYDGASVGTQSIGAKTPASMTQVLLGGVRGNYHQWLCLNTAETSGNMATLHSMMTALTV